MEEQYNILWNNNDEIGILNSYDKVKKLRDEEKIICKPIGTSITLNSGEAVMCGNCVGIKKNGRINLYDENGKPAGSKSA